MESGKRRRIYVIELADEAGTRNLTRFCKLYVGETGEPIRKRYKTHRRGGLYAADVVTEHWRRLRRDLYLGLSTSTCKAASERNERAHAELLRDLGYRVYTNGGWLEATDSVRELELSELSPAQLRSLDRAICDTLATASRALTPSLCAHVLWGSRGDEIATWGVRELPAYGLYAHVRHGALRERVESVIRERSSRLA